MILKTVRVILVLAILCGVPCKGVLFGVGFGALTAHAATVTEGFESGNLLTLPWVTDGNAVGGGTAKWTVIPSSGHTGSFAARAPISLADPVDGYYPDGELSFLETTLSVVGSQSISFWFKVSSEAGDCLRFKIDGVEQTHLEPGNPTPVYGWSGGIDWTKVTYNVGEGNHIFRWEYTKDASGNGGEDTAWIDDITVTNASFVLAYNITATSSGNGTISCQTPVNKGASSLCTISPTSGYHLNLSTVNDNGVDVPVSGDTYTIANVQENHDVIAKFVLIEPNDLETFETGDFSKFPWLLGGSPGVANWSVTPSGYPGVYGGMFAAEAPESLNDNETSTLETSLNIPSPGVMSFWYKVSSEEDLGNGGDYLRFYIDDKEQSHSDPVTQLAVKGWSGEIYWTQAQYPIDAGTHIFRWEYVKDGSGSSVNDRVWIDDIKFPGVIFKPGYTITVLDSGVNGSITCIPAEVAHGADSVCTIQPAAGYHLASLSDNGVGKLDSVVQNTYTISKVTNDHTIAGSFMLNGNIENFETGNLLKFPWSTGGNTNQGWIVTSQSGHPGIYGGTYAAETPILGDSQSSYLEIKQNVPEAGAISFWYRVYSEVQADYLIFYINGFEVERWSGNDSGWVQKSYPVDVGNYTFRWEYLKDFSNSVGEDKAWIDDIVFPGTAIDLPVKLVRGTTVIYKQNLQDAYDAAVSNDVIYLKAGLLSGSLTADKDIAVSITGGYDNVFGASATMSTIGAVNVKAGVVRLNNITVR